MSRSNPLSSSAGKKHRAVMLQHLETIQVIVSALAEEDYALAQTIPIKDLKRILPSFNNLLKVCVACHLEYTVSDRS
jgi:hypothetical protein